MLSMIANPVTALPVVYPRSGLSRSDLVLWPNSDLSGMSAAWSLWGKADIEQAARHPNL